jgi:hypothetical protein
MKLLIALACAIALTQAPPLTKAEQLSAAARKGDAAAVKKLLDEGVDVNTKFRYGATALFYASDHGHLEVVKVLLERGADMSLKDTFYGFTPLSLAMGPAQKKKPEHGEIAKLLIQKGAPGKEQALSTAVQTGDASLAKVILDTGVAAGSLSDALELAKATNKTEMVTLLEQAGAKPYQDFKVDPALLARFPGTYKAPATGNEFTVVAAGARLVFGPATGAGQRIPLVATGEKSFKAIGPPITVTFQVEGDKVSSLTVTQGANPAQVFTRVEGK